MVLPAMSVYCQPQGVRDVAMSADGKHVEVECQGAAQVWEGTKNRFVPLGLAFTAWPVLSVLRRGAATARDCRSQVWPCCVTASMQLHLAKAL